MLVLTIIMLGMGCDEDDAQPPDDTPTDIVTANIGPEGGTITLAERVTVVIPPNALSSPQSITLGLYDPSIYFDDAAGNHIVVECLPDGISFNKPVELFITAPPSLQTGNVEGLAGVIDPESGALEVLPTTGLTVEGQNTLRMEITHFSRYGGYFWEYPPYDAATIEIPHYNQGDSKYCWAAGLQMLCEAIRHESKAEMHDIIGYTGIDESGIGQYTFRFSSKISAYVKSRTGTNPDRKIWPWGSAYAMDGYIKDRIALGYPVLVFSPVKEHAFVVIGYEGNNFCINDPASTNRTGNLSYKWMPKDSFYIDKMEFNAKFVTLSIPASVTCQYRLESLNITDHGFLFKNGAAPSGKDTYIFRYDHQKAAGYSYKNGDGKSFDTIPGSVTELVLSQVQLANTSRTETVQLNVSVYIRGLNNNLVYKAFPSESAITLPPNSFVDYKRTIPVKDFVDPSPEATLYEMEIVALSGTGTPVDESVVQFTLGPKPSEAAFSCDYQVEYADGSLGSVAIEGEEEKEPLILKGTWMGDTYTAIFEGEEAGISFKYVLVASCDAFRQRINALTFRIEVEGIEDFLLEAEDLVLTQTDDTYAIDLTGQDACEPVTTFFEGDLIFGEVVDYFCDNSSYLKVVLPK